jgi:hypothetical protein
VSVGTTPVQLIAQLQRLWDRGQLLSSLVGGDPAFPLRLDLRAPNSADCTQRFEEVRAWALALRAEAPWRVEVREWRHPVLGHNALPSEVWIDLPAIAWQLLGKQQAVRRFERLIAITSAAHPELLAWLARRPLQALALAAEWERLLGVVGWLRGHPRPGIYLRQVDLPGVDTKFIEQHRAVLAELLDLVLPAEAIAADATGLAGFARRYGFLEKPLRIRLRALDPATAPLGTAQNEDLTVDAATLARLQPPVSRVFITENEVNFLAFPPVERAWIVFGAGYGLERLALLPWLRDKRVDYWGDIDTHGFAILDELRTHLPHADSFLMDRATLQAHRDQWVEEAQPVRRELPRLSVPERALYDDLRWQRLGNLQPRLEQERIGFARVEAALARPLGRP